MESKDNYYLFYSLGNLKRAQADPAWMKKIKIGKIEKVNKTMKLGDLSGNRFSLAIRFIEGEVLCL